MNPYFRHENFQGNLGLCNSGDRVPALLHSTFIISIQNLLLKVSDLSTPTCKKGKKLIKEPNNITAKFEPGFKNGAQKLNTPPPKKNCCYQVLPNAWAWVWPRGSNIAPLFFSTYMHHRSFLKTNFTPTFFTQQEVHNLTSTSFLKHLSKGFSDPNPIWPAHYQESKEFGALVLSQQLYQFTSQTGSHGPKFLYMFIITQHHQVATRRDYNFK